MSIEQGYIIASTGRLIATRVVNLQSVRNAEALRDAVAAAVMLRARSAITCSDWRDIGVLAPDVAEVLLKAFRSTNSRVLRGAVLLAPGQATFSLQLERILRAADHPARRAFYDARAMLVWLADLLTPEEAQYAFHFFEDAERLGGRD